MHTLTLRGMSGPSTAFDTMAGDTRFELVPGDGVVQYTGKTWTIRVMRGGLAQMHVELQLTDSGEIIERAAGNREPMARQAYTWLRLYGDPGDQARCPASPDEIACRRLTAGMLVTGDVHGTNRGRPVVHTITRRLDRTPWPGIVGHIVISDGAGIDMVRTDSVRVVDEQGPSS